MKNYSNIALGLIIISASIIILGCLFFNYQISPTGGNSDPIWFEVNQGDTYSTIAGELKEYGLIRSELFYKVYIKLFKPKSTLEAGKYPLSKNMGIKGILKTFSEGNTHNPDAVELRIPEGKQMKQIAEIAASVTNNTVTELLEAWNNKEFINSVKENYWFVTDEVDNKNIRYALEGYFFPSTYELTNENVDPEYIANKMLDQMGVILEKYKKDIDKLGYSVHEILTMASIVEYEAILDTDRADVAGVFYNRLDDGMKLQSCATLGYAIDDWKTTYTYDDMNTDSKYNTYYYSGLPVGPGGMAGEKSIEAAVRPNDNNYYYFMANVCDPESKKTYFATTYAEHQINVDKYLTCF